MHYFCSVTEQVCLEDNFSFLYTQTDQTSQFTYTVHRDRARTSLDIAFRVKSQGHSQAGT